MKTVISILVAALSVVFFPAQAVTLDGVEIPDTAQVGEHSLVLNGAGMRSAFVFDVYAIGLYLPERQTDAGKILGSNKARRVAIHCVLDEISKGRFDESIQDGLEDNLNDAEFAAIADRVEAFKGMFGDVVENDVVHIDFDPEKGTTLLYNGEVMGTIPGEDFNDALLSIWIGTEPVTKKLRGQLLGN